MPSRILATMLWMSLTASGALAHHCCPHRCPPPQWHAPSPTLTDHCRHTTGHRFASYSHGCLRDYYSPHARGYHPDIGYQHACGQGHFGCWFRRHGWASTGCCWGAQYGCAAWAAPAGVGLLSMWVGDPQIPDIEYAGDYRTSFGGWEHLGSIPNDALPVEAGGIAR